jgi:hypothetical protein
MKGPLDLSKTLDGSPRISFVSEKWSGVGMEGGAWGRREFLQINVCDIRRPV